MPELSREERIAKALAMSKSEEIVQEEIVQEENPKRLSREERIARALELSQAEDKKKVNLNRVRVRKNLLRVQAQRRRNNLRVLQNHLV